LRSAWWERFCFVGRLTLLLLLSVCFSAYAATTDGLAENHTNPAAPTAGHGIAGNRVNN
jgi:hypothetical protein